MQIGAEILLRISREFAKSICEGNGCKATDFRFLYGLLDQPAPDTRAVPLKTHRQFPIVKFSGAGEQRRPRP